MEVEKKLREKITKEFTPIHFDLVNESHMHSVPENSETHFRMLLVSEKFRGMNRVQRQRLVNALIQEELNGPVHAFSQKTLTPDEWSDLGENVEMVSPKCRGQK